MSGNNKNILEDFIKISENNNESINDTYDIDIKITDNDLDFNDFPCYSDKSVLFVCSNNEPGIILYANSKSENIIGFSQDFLIGKSVFSFMHPEDVKRIMDNSDTIITHRILTNFKDNNNKRTYKWFTSKNKKLENIVVVCSIPLQLNDII